MSAAASKEALQKAICCANALAEMKAKGYDKFDQADTHIVTLAAEVQRLQGMEADAARYQWLRRKTSAHGVIDGWEFGFPTHLCLPAPALAMRDPAAGLDAAIDAVRASA